MEGGFSFKVGSINYVETIFDFYSRAECKSKREYSGLYDR